HPLRTRRGEPRNDGQPIRLHRPDDAAHPTADATLGLPDNRRVLPYPVERSCPHSLRPPLVPSGSRAREAPSTERETTSTAVPPKIPCDRAHDRRANGGGP